MRACVVPQDFTKKSQGRAGSKRPVDDNGSSSFFAWLSTSGGDAALDEIGEAIKDDIWPNPLQFFLVGARCNRRYGYRKQLSYMRPNDYAYQAVVG